MSTDDANDRRTTMAILMEPVAPWLHDRQPQEPVAA
jgi:hypothetical protein